MMMMMMMVAFSALVIEILVNYKTIEALSRRTKEYCKHGAICLVKTEWGPFSFLLFSSPRPL